MDKAGIEKRLSQMCEAIASPRGLELVHVEAAGTAKNLTLRIFLDKPGGISIDECADVSRQLGDRLDEKDLIPGAYVLEVSSPGLDRPLYKLSDFEKFAGSLAKMRTHQPIDGQRNFTGTIVGVEGDQVVFDDKTSGVVKVPYELVAKANLEIDLEAELSRKR